MSSHYAMLGAATWRFTDSTGGHDAAYPAITWTWWKRGFRTTRGTHMRQELQGSSAWRNACLTHARIEIWPLPQAVFWRSFDHHHHGVQIGPLRDKVNPD
jgi:hypothetical protein